MKKHADKWERQLDKAAHAGDIAQIQHLLADEAAPTLDNLTKFDPSEAADFIQQSIQAAQNTAGLPSIPKHRKKISIAICIAAACLLATAGTYAAGRFSHRIFEEDGVVQDDYVRYLHENGLLVWVNPIVYDERDVISAGHTDDAAFSRGTDYGWGWLIDKGADILQTDWLLPLKEYICGQRKKLP